MKFFKKMFKKKEIVDSRLKFDPTYLFNVFKNSTLKIDDNLIAKYNISGGCSYIPIDIIHNDCILFSFYLNRYSETIIYEFMCNDIKIIPSHETYNSCLKVFNKFAEAYYKAVESYLKEKKETEDKALDELKNKCELIIKGE